MCRRSPAARALLHAHRKFPLLRKSEIRIRSKSCFRPFYLCKDPDRDDLDGLAQHRRLLADRLSEQGAAEVGEVRIDPLLGLAVPGAEKRDGSRARRTLDRDARARPHFSRVDRRGVEGTRLAELYLDLSRARGQELMS